MTAHVLVVCSANVCRSPMAEGLLRHHLAAAGADVQVTSAGTRRYDLPVDPEAVRALAGRGVDIGGHVPRHVKRDVIRTDGADLVVTMTREHLREVAAMERSAWPRTFTLRELVRRASAAGTGTSWADWLAEVGEGRRPTDLLAADPADDIADPYGAGFAAVSATATDLDELTGSLARLVPWHHLAGSSS